MEPDAVQHPDLDPVFESLVRTASALLLDSQLDLASATISLARRVRTASFTETSEALAAELGSVAKGMRALQARIGLLPHAKALPGFDLAVAWTNTCISSIRHNAAPLPALIA